jgi:3-dehydroquinate synthase
VVVRHTTGSYGVIVRTGALASLGALIEERHPGARVAIIADSTVAGVLGTPLPNADLLTFPAGEYHKSRETWSALTDRLIERRHDRNSVIVGFGGGVTTDLAGFVAATFLRGVPWIAVPTTTLAMLDAAIGGKTGVDTSAGKNLVGAFHPPSAVVCDPATLATLPDRTFREGLAEAIKHGVTLDQAYGEWIAANAVAILDRDTAVLEYLVHRSAELKAEVVSEDEREGDRRAVLNAGHTVAHALEQATQYVMPHGEAVAIGLVLETRVAEGMGVARAGTADRVAALFKALGLPVNPPQGIHRAAVLRAMQSDKKNRNGNVHAAFIASIGAMAHGADDSWTLPLDPDLVAELL